jgi:hypothetical protein
MDVVSVVDYMTDEKHGFVTNDGCGLLNLWQRDATSGLDILSHVSAAYPHRVQDQQVNLQRTTALKLLPFIVAARERVQRYVEALLPLLEEVLGGFSTSNAAVPSAGVPSASVSAEQQPMFMPRPLIGIIYGYAARRPWLEQL